MAEPLLIFKTPVLSSWWDRYDPYERALVARIRAGRHSPDLFDHNRLFLGERPPPGASPTFAFPSPVRNMTPEELRQARAEAAERRKEAMAEAKARRNSPEWQAEVEERKRIKAERHAIRHAAAIERERQDREWLKREAAREAQQKEREAEWAAGQAERDAREAKRQAEADANWEKLGETLTAWRTEAGTEKWAKRRFDEERAVLMNKWQCVKCKRVAQIKADGGGYVMSCAPCGIEARGTHRVLVGMLPRAAA